MSWGGSHDTDHEALIAARKMATAVRDYLAAPTDRNRSHVRETLAVFDRAVEQHDRPRSIPR
jgi:hypothetical protein